MKNIKLYRGYLLVICVVCMLGVWGCGAEETTGEKETKEYEMTEITQEEKQIAIDVLNETAYMSNEPSYSYGQIIERAFIDYEIEFERIENSVLKVTVSGVFMYNPEIESNYTSVRDVYGEERALEMHGGLVAEKILVLEVDIANETVSILSGASDTLTAYALDSF